MKKLYFTFFVLLSFLFGVFCGFLYYDFYFLKLWLVIFFVFGLFIYYFGRYLNIFYFILIFIIFLFGFFESLHSFFIDESDVSFFSGKVVICGVVDGDVQVDEHEVKSSFLVSTLSSGGVNFDVTGRVLLKSDLIEFSYADESCFSGYLKAPEPFDGFRYDRFLLRYGLTSIFTVDSFVSNYDFNLHFFTFLKLKLFKQIFILKHFSENRLDMLFSSPYSGFVAGLLFGSRGGLPDDLLKSFSTVGLTHIIAISGYNITVLILIVGKVFSFLSFRVKFVLSNIFIFLFVILVGAEASVIRAGIMGSISLLAILFNQKYLALLALIVSSFLMVLFNPLILIYDVGFQLSVLATLGLILYGNLFEKFFYFLPEKFSVRESMAMTLSAQVLVLPIIIANFKTLSVVSPFANVFVLPFLPYIMLFGFFALFFSLFSMFFGSIFAFFAYILLFIVIFFVEFFSKIYFASINMPNLSFWILFFYYYCFYAFYLRKFSLKNIV